MRQTLLDTFAAHALTGILLRPASPSTTQAATEAYTYAAAMLRERKHWETEKPRPLMNASPEAPYTCEEEGEWPGAIDTQTEMNGGHT